MVVVDAPDEEEDRCAMPCPGPDGVLLANMGRALGLQRINTPDVAAAVRTLPPAQRLYVTNALKCRPPHGQLPQAADLVQCTAWLNQELALVQPRVIVALGRFANQLLLGANASLSEQPLGKLRGAVYRYQGLPVVVSYHPRALLRSSADKGKAWLDWCLAAQTVATLD